MQKQWVGKNIDLKLLNENVIFFFESKGLKTKGEELVGGYRIMATSQKAKGVRGEIEVTILGNPADFVIETIAGRRARSSMMLGSLTTIFGGGSLFLQGLKSREVSENLEREFWVYIEEIIAHLINSERYPTELP